MTMPRLQDWAFSVKTFAAAMLALYLGFAMSVPRPYWAMATVYICSQPLSGATRSKSAYRVLGTLLGAAAAVALVPNLATTPELLVGALALWTALCLFVSLLDRTPRSYVFMLGGYTAALIGFPAVNDPTSIFDLAVARSEAITLGIVCASLVSGLVFPRPVGAAIGTRLHRWLGDGARFGLDALAGSTVTADRDLARLAADAAEIDLLATHVPYDSSHLRDNLATFRALRLRMLMLLPVLSSLADRVAVLRGAENVNDTGTLPPPINEVVSGVRAWIRPGGPAGEASARAADQAEADRLRAAIDGAEPVIDGGATWRDLVTLSLLHRLRDLLDLAGDCRILRRALVTGRRPDEPLAASVGMTLVAVRHGDKLLPLLSAAGVAIAIGLSSWFWIATGWPDGSSAPMMAAVATSFFSSRDDPAPGIIEFAVWSAVAIVLMGIYLFAVLPYADTFEMVVLALAPGFLLCGVMIAMPRTAGKGLALAANGSTLLALQGTYNADFASFANGGVAFLMGMALSAVVTQVLRSVGVEFSIRRLMRADAATLAGAARGRGDGQRAHVAGMMLDRLGLVAPRLAMLPEQGGSIRNAVAAPRIGLNIVDLRRARHGLASEGTAAVDELLDGVARHFQRTPTKQPAQDVLNRLDDALATISQGAQSFRSGSRPEAIAATRDVVLGLVGLRRALFPDAPDYAGRGDWHEPRRVAA